MYKYEKYLCVTKYVILPAFSIENIKYVFAKT